MIQWVKSLPEKLTSHLSPFQVPVTQFLIHLHPNVPGRNSEEWPQYLGPCQPCRRPDGVPGSCLQPDLALSVVVLGSDPADTRSFSAFSSLFVTLPSK